MDKVNQSWDTCITQALQSTALGAGAGLLVGLFLFKKKTVGLWYGAGIGTGYSYVLCETQFQKLFDQVKLK